MDCIFCRIASGEIPAAVIARSDGALAFDDLNPQAPTHLLIIPVQHIASSAHLGQDQRAAVLGEVMALAVQVAVERGLVAGGYRLVVNTGANGGQSVDHLHVHLLGGRQMKWPPG